MGYLAIFATIIPFAAFLSALHYIEATKAIVTSTLEPVIAGMAAYFLFVETLTPSQLVGAAMVIIAIMVSARMGGAWAAIAAAGLVGSVAMTAMVFGGAGGDADVDVGHGSSWRVAGQT